MPSQQRELSPLHWLLPLPLLPLWWLPVWRPFKLGHAKQRLRSIVLPLWTLPSVFLILQSLVSLSLPCLFCYFVLLSWILTLDCCLVFCGYLLPALTIACFWITLLFCPGYYCLLVFGPWLFWPRCVLIKLAFGSIIVSLSPRYSSRETFRVRMRNFLRAHALQFPVASLLPSYKEENKSMHAHELA